jgi:hypothetical protein
VRSPCWQEFIEERGCVGLDDVLAEGEFGGVGIRSPESTTLDELCLKAFFCLLEQ